MRTIKRNYRKNEKEQSRKKLWAGLVSVTLTLMLCLTINFRAFSEYSEEITENENLEKRIEAVTADNLAIQEHIHYLKNDPVTVEKEARRFGLQRVKPKVSVSAVR
jgi:cell division protein FtsB